MGPLYDSLIHGLSLEQVIQNSLLLDIGIPAEFGGDPGPAGAASMIQELGIVRS